MSTAYHPETSRALAEKAHGHHESDAATSAARGDFERYHSASRMLRLSAEVEILRDLVKLARRIRYSPDVGYVEVRHLFEAVRDLTPDPAPKRDEWRQPSQ